MVKKAYAQPIQLDNHFLSVTYSHPNSFILVDSEYMYKTHSYLDVQGNVVHIAYWDQQSYARAYPEYDPLPPTQALEQSHVSDPSSESNGSKLASKQSLQFVNTAGLKAPPPVIVPESSDSKESIQSIIKKRKVVVASSTQPKVFEQLQKWKEISHDSIDEEEDFDVSDETLATVCVFTR